MNTTNQTLLIVVALIIAASFIVTATIAIEPAEAKSAKKGESKSSDKGKGDGEVGTSALCAVCTNGPNAYA